MEPVITLKDIRVSKGKDFTLSVDRLALQPGLVYALTGPNGAGKSTLLRVMALLTPPQSGSITFPGSGAKTTAEQRRKVTLVEQSPYLFQGTIEDNLSYGLKLRGIVKKERDQRIQETLTEVGLAGFGERHAKELSGGETQRVALARALALKPDLLLLDEPTANIDSNSLEAYEELLSRLSRYGGTVVFSTHDPSQSRRLGDELLRIEDGRLLYDSTHSNTSGVHNERKVVYGTQF